MEPSPECAETKPIPSLFQRRTLWGAITALSIVVIGAIAVGFVVLTGTVLSYLQPILVPLAVAAIIAYLLEPIIAWLMRHGWPHRRALLVVYITFVVLVIVLAVSVVVPTIGQAREVYFKPRDLQPESHDPGEAGDRFPPGILRDGHREGLLRPRRRVAHDRRTEARRADRTTDLSRLRGAFGFFGYLLGLLLVPIYLYYFLQNGHVIAKSWSDYLPLKASKFKDEVVGTLTEINGYLISFFGGRWSSASSTGLSSPWS